eukprot:COSAG02_NODE_44_length_45948_cov_81.673493_20_plen_45_part_00
MEYIKLTDEIIINTVHPPGDHLESLVFLEDDSVNWHCFDSAAED